MSQSTQKINEALREFLESNGLESLEAVKIIFKEKDRIEKNLLEEHCEWVWNPITKELDWICYP